MSNITVPIISNNTKWNIETPEVYRYLPKKHSDEFFKTGKIRVSSFFQFSKHPDEEKGDKQEATNIIHGKGKSHEVFVVTKHGYDAYILSSSILLSKELESKFQSDSCIRIKDTMMFAIQISRKLPGFIQGFEGFCYYHDGVIRADIGNFELEQLNIEGSKDTIDLNKMGSFALNMAGAKVFFKKRLKYQNQSEYRFVWIVDHEVKDPYTVECPEAIQYCEQVTSY